MEIRHLRYFVAVAEELHFSRAAERLHMQQPPLSAQIRQLERELGVRLLERTTRTVSLTQAGTAFLDEAYEILRRVEHSAEVAQRADQGITGQLVIGFSGSATYSLLPIVSRIFRSSLPHAALHVEGELLATPLVEGLLNRRLDVGFGRLGYDVPELRSRVVRREVMSVILPEHHRLADQESVRLEDLAEDPFVTTPSRAGSAIYESTIAACKRAGFFPHIVQEASQTAILVSLVAGGFGVALAPESVAHLNVTGAVHRPIEGFPTATNLEVIWRRDHSVPLLRAFLAAVEVNRDALEGHEPNSDPEDSSRLT